jgi:hypothetical protein
MNKNISIIIGYNSNNLYGSNNDMNIINKLFKKINSLDIFILEFEQVTLSNIILYSNKYKNIENLIIYFSGNGTTDGKLELYKSFISSKEICLNLKSRINNLIFILDCCFSKKFISTNNFKNINCIKLYSSCSTNQKSKEVLIKINNEYKIHGIFTYYFCKLIDYKKIYNINDWNKINDNDIWFIIDKKFNQKFSFGIFFLDLSNNG